MTLLKFRAILHVIDPADFAPHNTLVNGVECTCLQLQQSDLQPFPCTFEEALGAMELLHRMFIVPDGSFVWVGEENNQRWQLDGVLNDWGGQLQHVEIQGECFETQLDLLLATLGSPTANVIFQLPEHSLYLPNPDFRLVSQTQ